MREKSECVSESMTGRQMRFMENYGKSVGVERVCECVLPRKNEEMTKSEIVPAVIIDCCRRFSHSLSLTHSHIDIIASSMSHPHERIAHPEQLHRSVSSTTTHSSISHTSSVELIHSLAAAASSSRTVHQCEDKPRLDHVHHTHIASDTFIIVSSSAVVALTLLVLFVARTPPPPPPPPPPRRRRRPV